MKRDKTYTGRSTIRMYNCDCMDLMQSRPDKHYTLSIVDPPYGENDAINIPNGNKHQAKRTVYKEYDNVKPYPEYFEELRRVSKYYIIWGGNYFENVTGGAIAWNKNGTAFGEGEIAICNTHKSVRFYELTWNGMIQHDMKNKEHRIHSNQKPVKMYKDMLSDYAKKGDNIFDSHGGSMSIAIACWDLGFDLDICELDTDYFNDAVDRFENHIAQTQMVFQ